MAIMAGLNISGTADLLGFSHTIMEFTENGPKQRKYPLSVVWMKIPWWCERSEENGQTGSRQEGNGNSKDLWLRCNGRFASQMCSPQMYHGNMHQNALGMFLKAKRGPTLYEQAVPNQVAGECILAYTHWKWDPNLCVCAIRGINIPSTLF